MLAGQSLQLGLRVVFKLADEDLSHGVDAITISGTCMLSAERPLASSTSLFSPPPEATCEIESPSLMTARPTPRPRSMPGRGHHAMTGRPSFDWHLTSPSASLIASSTASNDAFGGATCGRR
jgi:hypothetical protein